MAGEKPKEPWTGRTLAQFERDAMDRLILVDGRWQLDVSQFPDCDTFNPGSGCAQASGRAHARRLTDRIVNDPTYPWRIIRDDDGREIGRATHSSSLQVRVDAELQANREASRANLIRWTAPDQLGRDMSNATPLGSGSVSVEAIAEPAEPLDPDAASGLYFIDGSTRR